MVSPARIKPLLLEITHFPESVQMPESVLGIIKGFLSEPPVPSKSVRVHDDSTPLPIAEPGQLGPFRVKLLATFRQKVKGSEVNNKTQAYKILKRVLFNFHPAHYVQSEFREAVDNNFCAEAAGIAHFTAHRNMLIEAFNDLSLIPPQGKHVPGKVEKYRECLRDLRYLPLYHRLLTEQSHSSIFTPFPIPTDANGRPIFPKVNGINWFKIECSPEFRAAEELYKLQERAKYVEQDARRYRGLLERSSDCFLEYHTLLRKWKLPNPNAQPLETDGHGPIFPSVNALNVEQIEDSPEFLAAKQIYDACPKKNFDFLITATPTSNYRWSYMAAITAVALGIIGTALYFGDLNKNVINSITDHALEYSITSVLALSLVMLVIGYAKKKDNIGLLPEHGRQLQEDITRWRSLLINDDNFAIYSAKLEQLRTENSGRVPLPLDRLGRPIFPMLNAVNWIGVDYSLEARAAHYLDN